MTEKKTLFQIMKDKAEAKERGKEIPCPVANPLELKFDSMVSFAIADMPEEEFRVKSIAETVREVNHERFLFVDYFLLRQSDGSPVFKLRAQDDRCLLLETIDSFGFDEGFKEVIDDSLDGFTVHNADGATDAYARMNGMSKPWCAAVSTLIDKDKDGKITGNDPVLNTMMDYWDFSREVVDEANQKYDEFLFVEMSRDSGWFTLWRGREIHPSQVLVV
jgi:hypothetical protein